jgi:hypothetical protein
MDREPAQLHVAVRVALRMMALFVGVVCAYLTLLGFPEPFFPIATAHASVTLRATAALDTAAASRIIDSVLVRVSESELYDPAVRHRVFVFGDQRLWALFNGPYQGAIARNCDLGNAIFIPRLDPRGNRIVHFDGRSADAVGVLAHEIVHTFMERRVGLRYWLLPWWKREGYPEYVGSARGTRLESPAAYREAALAWKVLIEERGMTFDQVVASTIRLEDVRRP